MALKIGYGGPCGGARCAGDGEPPSRVALLLSVCLVCAMPESFHHGSRCGGGASSLYA